MTMMTYPRDTEARPAREIVNGRPVGDDPVVVVLGPRKTETPADVTVERAEPPYAVERSSHGLYSVVHTVTGKQALTFAEGATYDGVLIVRDAMNDAWLDGQASELGRVWDEGWVEGFKAGGDSDNAVALCESCGDVCTP